MERWPCRCHYRRRVYQAVDGALEAVAGFVHRHPFVLEQVVSDEMAEHESCEEIIHSSMMPNKALDAMTVAPVTSRLQSGIIGGAPVMRQLTSEVIRQVRF